MPAGTEQRQQRTGTNEPAIVAGDGPEPLMPTSPDFYHHYAPRPEHDVRLLVTETEVVTRTGECRTKPGFETEEQVEQWRPKRIELLRKGGKASRRLADKLAACTTGAWCLSPACPP